MQDKEHCRRIFYTIHMTHAYPPTHPIFLLNQGIYVQCDVCMWKFAGSKYKTLLPLVAFGKQVRTFAVERPPTFRCNAC